MLRRVQIGKVGKRERKGIEIEAIWTSRRRVDELSLFIRMHRVELNAKCRIFKIAEMVLNSEFVVRLCIIISDVFSLSYCFFGFRH